MNRVDPSSSPETGRSVAFEARKLRLKPITITFDLAGIRPRHRLDLSPQLTLIIFRRVPPPETVV